MRILGIDPGYAIVGYGVLDFENNKFTIIESGSIITPASQPFELRIGQVYDELSLILARNKPDHVAVEKLFYTTNQKTVIDVAQARGVILLAAGQVGASLFEYTPLQIKQAVVGYGKAEKRQMIQMISSILKLKMPLKLDDEADALSVAVCHGHSYNPSSLRIKRMRDAFN